MEASKIKINMDGTIRVKVLQYKRDGNTLTEKWENLTKHTEGIYYTIDTDKYGQKSLRIVFAKNGVYWYKTSAPAYYFNPDECNYTEHMEELRAMYANYEADTLQAAANGGWVNKLHICVMERLGHDVAPLWAAYEERKRKWAENERKRIEAAEKAEQQRIEAEKQRRAELLADGKEKLLSHQAVTVEQLELLAESVGYTIHGRTLGFMREKVSEAVLNTNKTVTIWGRKLTQRNISGTGGVVREIAARLEATTASEVPEISTTEGDVDNLPAEGEKCEIKHISEIVATCRLVVTCCDSPDGTHTYTDEWNYYNWLRNAETVGYNTIADKALTEAWTNIFLAAYRRGSGHVLVMNIHGELIDTVFLPAPTLDRPTTPTNAPQSTKPPTAAQLSTPSCKRAQNARKRPAAVVRHFRTTGPPRASNFSNTS